MKDGRKVETLEEERTNNNATPTRYAPTGNIGEAHGQVAALMICWIRDSSTQYIIHMLKR